MVGVLRGAACAATLISSVSALHTPPRKVANLAHVGTAEIADEKACSIADPFRQEMSNFHDLQYHSEMKIGGQTIQGIIDTGSFELVVFSKTCTTCGIAPAYDEKASTSYKKGNHSQVHAYGSGSCRTQDGRDDINLGCFTAPGQDMWMAMECQMPLLAEASFNAIIGIGPPGQPEFTARQKIEQLQAIEEQLKAANQPIPADVQEAGRLANEELVAALEKHSLVENFGMQRFSTCYGKGPGSPAYMIWNDIEREGQPGVRRIPVIGNITWSALLETVTLSVPGAAEIAVGCQPSCGAIVDTGTSLMGVPTSVFNAIAGAINSGGYATDCGDLSKFPDLVMSVGGHKLRFPPSSYIGTVFGSLKSESSEFMRLNSITGDSKGQCQLLLMDLGEQKTQFGSMFILGMPFFREYYTTFDLGVGRGSRSLLVSRATEGCEPDLSTSLQEFARRHNSHDITPRQVDVSKLRVPHWLTKRSGSGI
mmetsp:Transcript_55422/g.171676  ORF Transcript_55422/g.171676 Transcript_55422/m.171676 type:complete len:480 (-) Transcript_55422:92-1531(-)